MSSGAIWDPAATLRSRPLWPVAAPVLVAVAYYLGAEFAFVIGTLTQQFAPFWPPNVVLLCALLLAPRRHWPIYIAAAFPAHLLAERGMAMPALQLLGAFACNVSVALLNAALLPHLLRGPGWLVGGRNATLYLLVAVVAVPALVALAAGFEPVLGGADPQSYWHFWLRWFLSNALGNLTLTPFFLAWVQDDLRLPLMLPRRRIMAEALLLVVGLVLSCALAFEIPLTPFTQNLFPALLYLPVPLILAAAVRFGAKGASAAILIVTVEVLVLAMQNDAPFASLPPTDGVLTVQLFLAIMAAPTILLAALVEELRRTSERLSGMLDGISDCYYTLDRDGRITGVNAKGAQWWGAASPQELTGRPYSEVVGENGPEPSWVRRTIHDGLPVREELCSSGGRCIDLRAYPSARGLNIFCHDITERRAAEVAARDTQELLQSSLDALLAQIAILDGTGKILV